jgi:hypothetical protein
MGATSAANHNLIIDKIAYICIIDKIHACMHIYYIFLAFPKKKFSRKFYFSKSFAQFMASDINSFLNLDYPSSIISTNTRISRLKFSFIYKHTRSARDNESEKDLSNGKKNFYYNYCSYGNIIITNFHQYLFS